MTVFKNWVRLIPALLVLAVLTWPLDASATQTVSSTNDSGAGSLREVLISAGNGEEIVFDPGLFSTPQTIALASPLPAITSNVIITGPGASLLTIDAQNTQLTVASEATVRISGLTLIHGNSADHGGAIVNNGALTLSDCVVADSQSGTEGGAIYNAATASMTVYRCAFTRNVAGTNGGAISNAGQLTVVLSTFFGNSLLGGADNSTFGGGGLFNNESGTVSIARSTFTGNLGGLDGGGGIDTWGAINCSNSIVSGNTSPTETDFQTAHAEAATKPVIIENTLRGNATGIGIFANHGGPSSTVNLLPGSNAVEAGNKITTLTTDATDSSLTLSVALPSYIASTPGRYTIQIDDEQLVVTDVNVTASTLTVLRGSNSTPAIHTAGANVFLVGDQRGFPVVGAPDIGAYEVQGFSLTLVSGAGQTAAVNMPFAAPLVAQVKDGDQPVEAVTVTFTAPAQTGPSATFENNVQTATTDGTGTATSHTVSANAIAGPAYFVSASIPGVNPVNFQLTNTPGADGNVTPNPGTTPQTATVGTAFAHDLAVTVKDAAGAVVPQVEVTFTAPATGASAVFGNSTNTITVQTDDTGVAVAPATANTVSGAYTVAVTAGAGRTTSLSLTNTPDAVMKLTVTGPANAVAGTPFNVTVSAVDKYGNRNAAYTGTVHFTATDMATGVAVPADYTFASADQGTHIFATGATLITVGNQTIFAADTATGTIAGDTGAINVTPAPATKLMVSAPASTVAGVPFAMTVTALDSFGNVDSNYRGTVAFTTSDASGLLPANYAFTAADAGTHVFSDVDGATLKTAATAATITATDTVTSTITGSAMLRVDPAAASQFTVTAPATATAGVAFTVTVTAKDLYNNVAAGYTGTVHFTSTAETATLPADATLANGTGDFPVSITKAGSATITATDAVSPTITGTSGAVVVKGAAATHFQLTVPAGASVAAPFPFSVTALDQFGNIDTAYAGTIHFTSTDGAATLPGDSGLQNGQGNFSATLVSLGNQTITATDAGNAAISGTSSAISCTINVAPTLNPISDLGTIRKDSGTITVPLAGIAAGANEIQTLTVTASSSNPTLIPAINVNYASPAAAGSISFATAKHQGGTATISVTVRDNGGTAAGGVDSITRSFSVTVDATNIIPSFVIGPNVQVTENAGPQTIDGFATAVRAGLPDEFDQVLTFQVTTDKPELFTKAPAITRAGSLTFTPSPTSGGGTATMTVILHDDGGTENGGQDTTAPQSFQIAISSVDQAAGTYHGLVQPDPRVTASNNQAGAITVTVGKRGAFTGQLRLGGKNYALRGSFDQTGGGHFGTGANTKPTLVLARPDVPGLELSLQVDVGHGTDKLTGTVTLNNTPFGLVDGDRALYTAKKNPVAPFRNVPPDLLGRYTVLFAPKSPTDQGRQAAEYPQGYGIGSLTVAANGVAKLTGTLADGTPVSCSNTLSKTNGWPFYVALAGGKGSISAPVTFRPVDQVSDLDAANVRWFKPAATPAPKKARYPLAWPTGIKVDLVGSKLTVPPPASTEAMLPGLAAPDSDGNAELDFYASSLENGKLAKALNLGPKTKVTVLENTERVAFALNPVFNGTLLLPPNKTRTAFHGVVFQKQKVAYGFFLTPTESGPMVITEK